MARVIRMMALAAVVVAGAIAAVVVVAQAGGPVDVTTGAYGNLRTDWDPNEPGLSPSVVQSAGFGEIFSRKVKGSVYAQPLVVGGTVIVTTEEAYAYGINDTTGKIIWKRSFGKPFKASTIGCSDLKPYIGSTSTPVVDPSTGTIYLTTRLQVGKGIAGSHWYLQALSSSTGKELAGFPVEISGTPYNTPKVPFNEGYAMQRPALLLLNGVVYIAFASNCDIKPYRGIVVGMSAKTGAITTMWSDESGVGTDENSQAGIWQSGAGLVSDKSNRIILTTSNGVSPTPAASDAPPATLSESVLGLTVAAGGEISPSQFFAPSNAPTLDQNDEDLGSGGPIELPSEYFGTAAHPRLIVQVGKDGRIFLIDAENMGGFRQGPKKGDAVLQTLGPFDGVWGQPAAYGGQGGWVYVLESAGGGFLRALSYGLNGAGVPQLSSVATSAESFGYTSGSPLVTSNGTSAGSAVVWVVYSRGPNEEKAEKGTGGQLRAYAAMPVGGTLPLLWSAPIGTASKFSVPTAYDGRVYVGTRDGELIAFGASADAPVQAAPLEAGTVPVGASSTATLSLTATQDLTVTGPITASGYEPENQAAAAPASPAPGTTAGPSAIPPSGTTPITEGTVFSISQQPIGTSVPAGSTLRVQVKFAPVRSGPVVGVLSIPTSAGTRTVSVSGYGAAPGLLLSAPPLAFGTVQTGAGGKNLSLTFSNSSEHPETLTGYQLPGDPYTVSGLPPIGTVLAPRQAVTASLGFDPEHAGSYPSSLRIETDGGSAALPVTADAVTGFSRLAVSATSIDAGVLAVGQSTTVNFEVGNSGTVPLIVTRAIAPLGAFSANVPVPEGIIIEPGTFLHQSITFTPTHAGAFADRYIFRANNGQGPVSVTFLGRGR